MPDFIRDGTGSGKLARVNDENQLATDAKTEDTLAWVARTKALAFAASSEAITTDGTVNDVFIIKNPSTSMNIIISELSISCTTDVAIVIKIGEVYSAGGTGILPVNLNTGSALTSSVTITDCYYGDDLTLTGTARAITNHVNLANVPFREPSRGSIIIGTNKAMSVSLDAAAGIAFVAVKYYEVEQES